MLTGRRRESGEASGAVTLRFESDEDGMKSLFTPGSEAERLGSERAVVKPDISLEVFGIKTGDAWRQGTTDRKPTPLAERRASLPERNRRWR
jgi:hypothetical protein